MHWGETIVSFENVSFGFGHNRPILSEASFSVRRGAKLTLMGQNGAGKSTIFSLLTGEREPDEGDITIKKGLSIATARQIMPRDCLDLTVREYFARSFTEKVYAIDPKIDAVLEVVNLPRRGAAVYDKRIGEFSGGQQARLLLAAALIQNPDLLLLDEPTNNLDHDGIDHLTDFLKGYNKTCIVISHDASFLNAFTHGVIYLDVATKKTEQYLGAYDTVVKEIAARVNKEQRLNAQMKKQNRAKKEKANFFANKGGNLRAVAKRMREAAQDAEESMVEVRKDDKTIRPFTIPTQESLSGVILTLTNVSYLDPIKHTVKNKKVKIELRKGERLLLSGPNGIGKTTLLEAIAGGTLEGESIKKGVSVGYYRQDFSTLNPEHTVYESLESVMEKKIEQDLRSCAAGFLLTSDIIGTNVGALSEGQKGLVAFARLVLQKPGLSILDEPTNHINFRHLPIIAKALNEYQGAMVLVSHVPEFIEQIRIDDELKLG